MQSGGYTQLILCIPTLSLIPHKPEFCWVVLTSSQLNITAALIVLGIY
jgi:hypothetical protein